MSVELSTEAQHDAARDELARLTAEIAQRNKDWDALMVLIAETVGDEDEREMAAAEDMEEFDPWSALRRAQLTADDRAALLWLAMQPIRVSNEQERARCVRALEAIDKLTRGGE